MKTANEVLSKMKGTDKVAEVVTGKGAFSKAGFSDLTSALANDTTFKIKTYDKDGKVTGEVSVSELIRSDLKKTLEKAKYPQKTEAGILDTCEIVTNGLAEAIPQIVMQQIAAGKKFDLPIGEKVQGSIYLKDVPGKKKTVAVRDPKTQESLGTCEITTKDSIAVGVKSQVLPHLQSKVRKDNSGKVVK